MSRLCPVCRKNDVFDTYWDKFRFRLMYWLFGEDVADVRQGAYTQGIVDGRRQAKEEKEYTIDDVLKHIE